MLVNTYHQRLALRWVSYGVFVQGYICHYKCLKIHIDLSQGTLFCFVPPTYYYPRTTLALPPSSNSDLGSHRGPSPLPTTVPAIILVGRIIQHFLPSLNRVKSYLPKLLGAFSSGSFLAFLAEVSTKVLHFYGCKTGRPLRTPCPPRRVVQYSSHEKFA